MTSTDHRVVRIGTRTVPVVPPRLSDPRLHLASVILTVHTVGLLALGFRVSVFQILAAIGAGALVEASVTLARTGRLVWPASGMLTGSGVALILRLTWMEPGSYWVTDGWWVFAAVAAASVSTKYLFRWRGEHLFNPSNLGLVVTFLLFGPELVEPLDFWWAPLGPWMLFAYAVIIGGGVLITRRLDLLVMAAVGWVVFAVGLGVLAASGHCMTATWSPDPVCGSRFWGTILSSPELLIFLFFMITDPATVPRGRAPRMLFAATVATLSTLLIAPQPLEFGAKVGLLAGLVVLTPFRSAFEGFDPAVWVVGRGRSFASGIVAGALVAAVGVGIVVAGDAARPPDAVAAPVVPEVTIDPATLPAVTVDDDVATINLAVDGDRVALDLAEDLALETLALDTLDPAPLDAADTRHRLEEMLQALNDAVTTGERRLSTYRFESIHVRADHLGGQTGAALALETTGVREDVVVDGEDREVQASSAPFASTFVMVLGGDDRWRIAQVVSPEG